MPHFTPLATILQIANNDANGLDVDMRAALRDSVTRLQEALVTALRVRFQEGMDQERADIVAWFRSPIDRVPGRSILQAIEAGEHRSK